MTDNIPEVIFVEHASPRPDRAAVTMNRPLQPWGPTRFHKALAMHIHQATRPAGHGHQAANFGMLETEKEARGWEDGERVVEGRRVSVRVGPGGRRGIKK